MEKTKDTLIIGGGIAGLTVGLELANRGLSVGILEKEPFPGGHGARFSCKAIETCVKCGACRVEQTLLAAVEHPNIELMTGCRISTISRPDAIWNLSVHRQAPVVSARTCNRCGACIGICPQPGALLQAPSAMCRPLVSVDIDRCLAFQGDSCSICSDCCPEDAFDLKAIPETISLSARTVVLAAGFRTFHPVDKPYGYGHFPDVITNLELENMLRSRASVLRISDETAPQRIAFIQCVGSRDASLGHLWCSRVCCSSALRMALWIRGHSPETEITVFYMDIQTFGKDFDTVYDTCRSEVEMIRAIPGDIHQTANRCLQVTYFEPEEGQNVDAVFDMVVLSVGMMPNPDAAHLAAAMAPQPPKNGFLDSSWTAQAAQHGIFGAGTVKGPLNIADTIADAQATAFSVFQSLQKP